MGALAPNALLLKNIVRVEFERERVAAKKSTGKTTGRASGKVPPPAEGVAAKVRFPIVGMGASAGGLEACEQFFRKMPVDSGMAFVLVSHLAPDHVSLLTEILQRTTRMTVLEAREQMDVAPNVVHVIPPNCDMTIAHGRLTLNPPTQRRGLRLPIDAFFRSLAEDQGELAIGIIFSGTGRDGTQGLSAILGAGGVSLVQEPGTAKYDGMPRSAIDAGVASQVLAVEAMPQALLEGIGQPSLRPATSASISPPASNSTTRILQLLRSRTGHDFSQYKKSTISRRLERRMNVNNMRDEAVYLGLLEKNPDEVKTLFNELLINVTHFFRDPEAFALLKRDILPKLLADKPANHIFRVWVAACASGEEAYSIAILLRELLDETETGFSVQIYATDLDDDAIAIARTGLYPSSLTQDVTPERLRRFFIKEGESYKIKKEIRDMVVFAVQNVTKDPPFTRLDLLCCRNLLIYLEPELQNRLIATFHFALNPGGVLFLSPSESIGQHFHLFSSLNRKWKFYQAIPSLASSRAVVASSLTWNTESGIKMPEKTISKNKPGNFAELATRALLQFFAPASVVTDMQGNILFMHGDTSRYLRPRVTLNVVDMAREGLQLELRSALLALATPGTPAVIREVEVKINGDFQTISLGVRHLPNPEAAQDVLLISFQDVTTAQPATLATPGTGASQASDAVDASRRIKALERDLAYTKEILQSTIQEKQASVEELRSNIEETQSTNEELQATNEELETSKEEQQSVNEELVSVNAELQSKIDQLSGMQNDMKNLLDNVKVGTILLDEQMIIRRFTREVLPIYRLVATDVGRRLDDFRPDLEGADLIAEARTVLDSLVPLERELRSSDGTWFLVRIQPYWTLDNAVEGVVLTFTDVSGLKRSIETLENRASLLSTAQAIAHLGCWELDVPTDQVHWSEAMFDVLGYPPGSAALSFREQLDMVLPQDRERVAAAMQASLASGLPYDVEYQVTCPDGVPRTIHARGEAICNAEGRVKRVVGTVLDITQQRKAEAAQLAQELAEGIVDAVFEPFIVLDDRLQAVSASRSFYDFFQVDAETTLGRKIHELGNGQWNIPALRALLEDVLPRNKVLQDYEVEHDFPAIGRRRIRLNARCIETTTGQTRLILLSMRPA